MNTKHTPGPWNWHGPYMTGAFKVTALAEDDAILCQVYITGENAAHDAPLIAAAPDLLAALQVQIEPRARGWNVTDWELRDEQARAAIAKATS